MAAPNLVRFTINLESVNVCRFYAGAGRHYVELDPSVTCMSSANVLGSQKKHATRSSGPPNYPGTGDVTSGHMITGNRQHFVLDAEAVNGQAFPSSQRRDVLQ